MPDMTFSNPSGQQITVNSPDGSTPSEGELDQLFTQAHGQSDSNTQDNSKSDGDPFADNQQPEAATVNPKSTGNPITDISGDLARGLYNSGAATLDKVNGVVKLINNVSAVDLGSKKLTNASNQLRNIANQQPQSNNAIISGIGQFVGATPDAIAEFAGTGGGVGFIARSAALSAADEYNKSQTPTSLIKGAAIGGTVGLAIDKLPNLLDSTARMAQKWGQTAGKAYWKAVTGASEEDAQKFVNNINDYNLDPKSEAEDYNDAKAKSSQELSNLKENNNNLVAQQKEQYNKEYDGVKSLSDDAIKKLNRNNDDVLNALREAQTEDKINLVRSNSTNMMAASDAATQRLADVTTTSITNTANAKNAAINDFVSNFETANKKLGSMVEGVTDNVANANATLEKNNLAFVPTSIIKNELDKAIGSGIGKFYKEAGTGKRIINIGGQKIEVPEASISGINGNAISSKIIPAEGAGTGPVSKAIELINDSRKGLVDEFASTGKTSLTAIEAQSTALENAISKGFSGQTVPKNLVAIMSKIKGALTLTRNSLDENGKAIPGLYDKYPEQLSHLKPLADANKAYSTQIDGLRNALSLYKDGDGSINPDKIFKAFDRNDTAYLSKLKQADSVLPKEDRIFDKIKDSYNKYKYAEKSEKENLSKIEKQVSQQRVSLKTKFDDMEQKLSTNQMRNISKTRQDLRYQEQDFSRSEKNKIDGLHDRQTQALKIMRDQKNRELDALHKSINDRLNFLHIQNMARGERANAKGVMRQVQNVANYRSINGMMTANPMDILQGMIINKFSSPIKVSNLIKDSINAPKNIQGAKNVIGSKVLKRLLATKASGR